MDRAPDLFSDTLEIGPAGDEDRHFEIGALIALTYSRWLGGDESRGQLTTWRVRMDGIGLIAVIELPAEKVTRYKDEWIARVLPDNYLLSRLLLRMPPVRKPS